jgi:hypothetical protein
LVFPGVAWKRAEGEVWAAASRLVEEATVEDRDEEAADELA